MIIIVSLVLSTLVACLPSSAGNNKEEFYHRLPLSSSPRLATKTSASPYNPLQDHRQQKGEGNAVEAQQATNTTAALSLKALDEKKEQKKEKSLWSIPKQNWPCFSNREQLNSAVDGYIAVIDTTSSSTSTTRKQQIDREDYYDSYYGPIEEWCVSSLTDFTSVFSARRNHAMKFFNADLSRWDVSRATLMTSMFHKAEAFFDGENKVNDLSNWDVSRVRSMDGMFRDTIRFTGTGLQHWNVSSVKKFNLMFKGASSFNEDLSTWDVSVTDNLCYMFTDALAFNQDLCSWGDALLDRRRQSVNRNHASVNSMFHNTPRCPLSDDPDLFATPVAGPFCHVCTVENTNQYRTFATTQELYHAVDQYLLRSIFQQQRRRSHPRGRGNGKDNVSNKIKVNGDNSNNSDEFFLLNHLSSTELLMKEEGVSGINHGHDGNVFGWVTETYGENIGDWGVSRIANFSDAFSIHRNPLIRTFPHVMKDIDLTRWDVSSATTLKGMFSGASMFDSDLSRWDVSNVWDMSAMFQDATSFRGAGLRSWDISSATDTSRMFAGARNFHSDLSNWNVSNVHRMAFMFWHAVSFYSTATTFSLSAFADDDDDDIHDLLQHCGHSSLSRWDVSKVTDMQAMFRGAVSFNSDLSRWDVSNVVQLDGMFMGATSFQQDLCAWGDRMPLPQSMMSLSMSPSPTVERMFSGTNCISSSDPELVSNNNDETLLWGWGDFLPPVGPLCFPCGDHGIGI